MAILDDDGRLFGKINLIDAAVVLLIFALVPLAYGSWVLFRAKTPVIQSISPAVVRPGDDTQYVQLRGLHLRPVLRVYVGSVQATWLYESPGRAELRLPRLEPGTFDVALFDESAELARLAGALTVGQVPLPVITTITPHALEYSKEPQRIEFQGERLSAALRVFIGKTPAVWEFTPPSRGVVQLPQLEVGSYDVALFDAEKELVRYEKAVTIRPETLYELTLVVRFVTRTEVLEMVNRAKRQPDVPGPATGAPPPVLLSYDSTEVPNGTTVFKSDLVQGRTSIVIGRVRAMAVKTAGGWMSEGRTLKAGALFTLNAPSYVLNGEILSIDVGPARKQ